MRMLIMAVRNSTMQYELHVSEAAFVADVPCLNSDSRGHGEAT